jgi:HEPN domain-containing protein
MKLPDLSAEDARAWMEKAKIDLLSARALLDNGIISSALFHTQQAAEKSLKAFLTWHQTPFRRVHDLEELGAICERIDGSLSGTVRQSEPLTAYA